MKRHYLGHSFAEGDDSLLVFGQRLDGSKVKDASLWSISSTDDRILLNRCYPSWNNWPSQESYFNQRYMWVNAEFTPRETMRGKMALYGYLYALKRN